MRTTLSLIFAAVASCTGGNPAPVPEMDPSEFSCPDQTVAVVIYGDQFELSDGDVRCVPVQVFRD